MDCVIVAKIKVWFIKEEPLYIRPRLGTYMSRLLAHMYVEV